MADFDLIKPGALPAAPSASVNGAIPIDNAGLVQKATPKQIVDSGRPFASQAQAEAGTSATVAMSPLTTKQAIEAVVPAVVTPFVELAEAWAESPTPPNPGVPDSKSSKTWADESMAAAVASEAAADRAGIWGSITFNTVAEMIASPVMTSGSVAVGTRVSVRGISDYVVVSSGGMIVTSGEVQVNPIPTATGSVPVSAFGAGKDGWLLAIERGAGIIPLSINESLEISYSSAAEVPFLPNNTVIHHNAPVTMRTFGVPLYFNESAGDKVTLWNPHIIYDAEATMARPAIGNAMYTRLFNAPFNRTSDLANRDQYALTLFLGTDLTINGTFRVESKNLDDPKKLAPRAIVIGTGPNAEGAKVSSGDFHLDGTLMGIQAFGYDILETGDIYSDHWGQLSTSDYVWEVPCHVIYCTPMEGASKARTTIGDCFDNGTPVGTPDWTAGSCSYKFTNDVGALQAGSLVSFRTAGILDIIGKNIVFNGGLWDGSDGVSAHITTNKALRFGVGDGSPVENMSFGEMSLIMPPDYNDSMRIFGRRIRGRLGVELTGSALSSPMVLGDVSDSLIDLDIIGGSQAASNLVIFEVRGSGKNNRFEINTTSPDWATIRVVETDKNTATGNTARITHIPSGSTRDITSGQERRVTKQSVTYAAISGGAKTISGAFPAYSEFRGVSLVVPSALGGTAGLTGFKYGIGSDDDMFGSRSSLTAPAELSSSNYTAVPPAMFSSSTDVILSPLAGTFDGTGEIRVFWSYEQTFGNIYVY